MAYVVARRNGRFEIRESLHTPKGPRARTLAGFDVLTDDVLAAASRKAQRRFDAQAVIRSGRRAGAQVRARGFTADATHDRFMTSSRRMASSLGHVRSNGERDSAGAALLELLGFADAVTASQPPRPFKPLAFPPLARLVEARKGVAIAHLPQAGSGGESLQRA
jgi:hypothetical protein